MKTILVIYSNRKKTRKEIGYTKRYAFNTAGEVAVGDLLDTNEYDTSLLVVEIMDKSFKYFNKDTGELSDDFTSSKMYNIKTLDIVTGDNEAIKAWKVEDEV